MTLSEKEIVTLSFDKVGKKLNNKSLPPWSVYDDEFF